MRPFTLEQINRLQAATDDAIWMSHEETANLPGRRARSATVPEEDYVASLILVALPRLATSWTALLQQWGVSLTLTGVFCHQTPKAKFTMNGSTVSSELADLLIVRRHVDSAHQVRECAVLIQAKMSDDGRIALPNGDPQLHLYITWPSFQVIGQNAPTHPFSVGRIASQALYAGITKLRPPNINFPMNKGWASFCPWAVMPPRQTGWVEDPLSSFLMRLLNFQAGRDFFDPSVTGCHWSELIHYLLTTTFSLPLRTRDMRSGPDDPRGGTHNMNRMAFMSTTPAPTSAYVPPQRAAELGDGGEEPPTDLPRGQFATEGSGRVIAIETWETHE